MEVEQRRPRQEMQARMANDGLETQLKVYKGVSVVASILFGIAGLIFAWLARYKLRKAKVDFVNVIENWQTPFYFDIVVNPANQSCPGNFSDIILSEWPGTGPGCDCRNTNFFLAGMYRVARNFKAQRCTYNMTMAGCDKISPIPTKKMYNWKGEKKFCGQTYKGIDFSTISDKFENDIDCLPRTIKCGVNKTHSICLPDWLKSCPISDIVLTPISRLLEASVPNNRILQTTQNGQNFLLQVKKNTSMPLVEMRVSFEKVCFDNDLVHYPPDLASYSLFKEEKRGDCEETDPRFARIDSLDEKSFLTINKVPFQTLPIFREDLDRLNPKMDLFFRHLIPWKIDCQLHMGKLISHQSDVIEVSINQNKMVIATVVTFIFLTVIFPIVQTCILCKTHADERGRIRPFGLLEQSSGSKTILAISGAVGWLAKLVQIYYFYRIMIQSGQVKDFFSEIAAMNCSDELTNQSFRHISETLERDAYTHNRNGFWIEVFFIVVNVISAVREMTIERLMQNNWNVIDAAETQRMAVIGAEEDGGLQH